MARRVLFALSLASYTAATFWPFGDQQLWFTSNTGAFSTFNFDGNTLTNVSTTLDAGYQPGWVDKHPWLHVLYTPARGQPEGGVNAWSYDKDGKVAKIASGHTNGNSAVHCEISRDGKTLAVPNINGANVAIFAVRANGTFAADPAATFTFPFYGVGPNAKEQSASRPHQARFDGFSRFLYIPNLGTDRLHVFRHKGAGQVEQLDDVVLPVGSGPRHLTFWPPIGPSLYMYLLNQLSNVIMVFDISTDSRGAVPKLVQTISTRGAGLPPSTPTIDINAAEVVVTPDARFLIASNRNDTSRSDDTLVSFSINPFSQSEHLTFQSLVGTGGKNPRDHAIDPTGRYVAVTNQDTGITVVERDIWTGEFKDVVTNYKTKSPVSVLWRPIF
ncbi:lactonase, 7-bladed beta-propeller [Rhizoctonia solani]|uniref:Lactonase, 7-bladed beta-propeller n=1 Tax=Rhizoctonia solani TaxID=456999 RepID=A0A8H8NQR5_9AGAM|nr:lactonase, 7-bladed beta-propeller [Rhizoctonia solani]QRW18169.1 lactonase, 7-bladed beta-propeller [Rhizoctonia solani]